MVVLKLVPLNVVTLAVVPLNVVAFDVVDMSNMAYTLSNLKLNLQGTLVSDDVSVRKRHFQPGATLDEMVEAIPR